MKIFITGGTGYIGNPLALKLAGNGNVVHALTRDPAKAKNLIHPNIRVFRGDVCEIESLRVAMTGCEQVYHLAAFVRLWAKPAEVFYKVNVGGTKNVLRVATENYVRKLVHTSSTAVFGTSLNHALSEDDPRTIGFDNDYDLSKCMAERLVLDFVLDGLPGLIVNPSRVYGPGKETYSNPVGRSLKTLKKGNYIVVPRCPGVVANYCYVDDVVEGHMLAMEHGMPGQRYILGGENISYRQLFGVIRETLPGRNAIAAPRILLKVAGALQLLRFYLTGLQPDFTPTAVDRYYANTAFTCEKAIKELNYKVTPFRQGMADTINFLKQQI